MKKQIRLSDLKSDVISNAMLRVIMREASSSNPNRSNFPVSHLLVTFPRLVAGQVKEQTFTMRECADELNRRNREYSRYGD